MAHSRKLWLQCFDKVPNPTPATNNAVDVLDMKIILTDRLYNALLKRFPNSSIKLKVKK